MSRRGQALLVFFLAAAFCCRAAAPVLPFPKQVDSLGTRHPASYGSFVLKSDFGEDVTGAVFGEIVSLGCQDASRELSVGLGLDPGSRGYELLWNGCEVRIKAADAGNAIFALQTLKQLLRAGCEEDLSIVDWADMEKRVFMDDISRGSVPSMEQMKRQIRFLSELKYNACMFYNENVISTASHPDIAPPDAAISLAELDEIIGYARSYGIEIIGAFQSFGHFEKTLSLPQYRGMGLSPNAIDPRSPAARAFLEDVIPELCAHSSSDYFCVFCDETFDIEALPDREELYASHLNFLDSLLASCGKRMIACGDMMMKYPRVLGMISKDIVIFSWNYDDIASYSGWLEPFDGFEVWVAPGVHSSLRLLPDIRVAEGNRRFVREGCLAGARGAIVCTWDESVYHSVENLNWNVAQFAETIWDVSRVEADDDFAARYEIMRFGAVNGVTGLYKKIMALSDVPMFSGLNDRVFYTRFTPGSGRPLVVDGRQVARAYSIISSVSSRLAAARSVSEDGAAEIRSWDYALRCYRFMVDSRKSMMSLSASNRASVCDALEAQLDTLSGLFSGWWTRENRAYNLDTGLAVFEDKRRELQELRLADLSGLEVIDRINPYMGFFLTALLPQGDSAPVGPEWPTPGRVDRSASGKDMRWTKTESLDGLMMNLNRFYDDPVPGTEVRSYARITAQERTVATLLLGYVGEADVYLGGKLIWRGALRNAHTVDEFEIPLELEPGQNHLTVVMRKQFPEFSFSAYLDGPQYKSNKYRYTLL